VIGISYSRAYKYMINQVIWQQLPKEQNGKDSLTLEWRHTGFKGEMADIVPFHIILTSFMAT